MRTLESIATRFTLESIVVYKVGQKPEEQESHRVILDALAQISDSPILLVAKTLLDNNPVIPLLQLNAWDKP